MDCFFHMNVCLRHDFKNWAYIAPDYVFVFYYLFIWLHWVLAAACKVFIWSMWDLVPWPRIEPRIQPRPLALGAWSLSHWTTREVTTPDCIMSMLHCLDTYRIYVGRYVFFILVAPFKCWRILVSLEKWKVWSHMPPGPHPPGPEGCPLGPGVPPFWQPCLHCVVCSTWMLYSCDPSGHLRILEL